MRELSRTPPAMVLDEPPAIELDDESSLVICAAAGVLRGIPNFFFDGSRGGLMEPP